MKKIFLFLVLFIAMPLGVNAYGISEYNIDMEVLKNGDIRVVEKFKLEGDFNGFERIIDHSNPYAMPFDGTVRSFEGSDIYNATDIDIIKVSASPNFETNTAGFIPSYNAVSGDTDVYSMAKSSNGIELKIFNPSSEGKRVFYIEYIIKDVVVLHNDVAEVAWNVFGDIQNESIGVLKITVKIPDNKTETKVWARGPLHGFSEIVNPESLYFEIEDLHANVPLSIRFTFDKIVNAAKKSNVDALDKILEVETKRADEANELRDKERKKEETRLFIGKIADGARVLWIAGLVLIIRKVYIEHDKEYDSSFQTKYFRDFPEKYGPSVVGYLINKTIGTKEMSSVIMDLIQRKVIVFDEVKKKDFVFKKNYTVRTGNTVVLKSGITHEVTNSEIELMEFLFATIAKRDEFKMEEINKYAKKNYDSFLTKYNSYLTIAKKEAYKYDFFEEKMSVKAKSIFYVIFGAAMSTFAINFSKFLILPMIVIFAAIVSTIYFATFIKRTKIGNEQYVKWIGLKNFINDFGNFSERDLPQIHLWEKYLVYAVVFGNAKKLAKAMEIKFKEISQTDQNLMFNIYYFNTLTNLDRSISSGISSAVSSAQQIRSSQNSSGSGGGGGFSGGGGSFGGGGGGGRF